MNKYIFKVCDYIVNSDIKNINIDYINNVNYNLVRQYISTNELYSFSTKIRIFQKLVLYNYCYNLYIGELSENELSKINNYISTDITKLNLHVDNNYLEFFRWCKTHNKQFKNKIKVISSKDKYNIVFYLY